MNQALHVVREKKIPQIGDGHCLPVRGFNCAFTHTNPRTLDLPSPPPSPGQLCANQSSPPPHTTAVPSAPLIPSPGIPSDPQEQTENYSPSPAAPHHFCPSPYCRHCNDVQPVRVESADDADIDLRTNQTYTQQQTTPQSGQPKIKSQPLNFPQMCRSTTQPMNANEKTNTTVGPMRSPGASSV